MIYTGQTGWLPALADDMDLITKYGARTIAVTLNGAGGPAEELYTYGESLQAQLGIPVLDPLHGNLSNLLPAIKMFMGQNVE